jgi:hypothetical protein
MSRPQALVNLLTESIGSLVSVAAARIPASARPEAPGTLDPGKAIKVTYEFSIDKTDALNDRSGIGKCMPATGNGIIAFADNATITLLMSGLDCYGMFFNGTLRLITVRFGGWVLEIGSVDGNGTEIGNTVGNGTPGTVRVTVDATGGFQ